MAPRSGHRLGRAAEWLALLLLLLKGYRFRHRNWRGAGGELDLVVERRREIVFVEVKARSSEEFGGAAGAMNEKKRKAVVRAASAYLVINVDAGRICLRTADSVLLDVPCSAGSGAVLRDPATGRVWEFTTPTGIFSVKTKAENPLWHKPDWAYLEEGLPVPVDPAQRVVEDELGGFSIDLGDGLYIHGTLYTRLLGMNVTHGCIRVADEDLVEIYHAVEVGTPVYIF